ncbi:unnamed protein product [Prorocentrum cordatum]|uniref:Uncharacterized protein n=1 Tax=Prorocentrum cordatum TaxID=2364126 RepID=A0ABN9QX50_9DINO|nr:unnamed protein product [Polarella glacialis]
MYPPGGGCGCIPTSQRRSRQRGDRLPGDAAAGPARVVGRAVGRRGLRRRGLGAPAGAGDVGGAGEDGGADARPPAPRCGRRGRCGGRGRQRKEEEWHAFRERLRSRRAEPSVQLLGCADVGHAPGRGRRVLSCRLGLDPGSARELGRLAYPQFFVERSSRKRTTAGSSGASGARRASLWRSWSCGSSPSRGRLRGRKATAP